MKAGVVPTHYTSTGLAFSDGTRIPADVIVFATGFGLNLKDSIRGYFGDTVADQTDHFFGLNDEGEMRGAWSIQRERVSINMAASILTCLQIQGL